jgi:beta-glucosidase
MQAWYGGQEAGNAIADVVFGDENPSGKLPMTFVRRWQDHPAFGLYPTGTYTDGLNVGYRHFDKPGSAAPAFPFGFGLSYTSFTYSNLQVDAAAFASAGTVRVEFDIQNTGARAGSEVAQVYIGDQLASVPRPEKELKGFAKAALAPGGTQHVVITLDRRAFAFFSLTAHDWVVEAGDFEILVGASSRDIRLQTTIALPAGM